MSKKAKVIILVVVAVMMVTMSFAGGCLLATSTRNNTQAGISGTELINQAWDEIYKNYVDRSKLDETKLSHGAIQGIMTALDDPYSAYLEPDTYKLFQNDLQGTFEGIGAQVELNSDNQVTIAVPLENSPAQKAGIKSGDIIIAVNGESVAGLSVIEVVLKIRGPKDTPVTLTVQHAGETATEDITITRAQISQTSVKWEMKGDITYIRITEFGEKTNSELNNVLASTDLSSVKGIILDLRSNPGGLVTSVVDIASHFVKSGVIITLVDNKGSKTSQSVNPNGVFTNLPIVILVNEFSASGSEVLTGALRDHQRATVAGVKTFGKGSYDVSLPLDDGSAIYLTVGRWLTPNGDLIEGQGITPDYVLTQTGDDEIQWAIDYLHANPSLYTVTESRPYLKGN
jgi:carboxyl-terminal processing protease